MPKTHQGSTNETTEVKLTSSIQRVMWSRLMAAPGATVGLDVFTQYVGNGAELEIKLTDHTGKTHGTFKDKLSANRFKAEIKVPAKAEAALFAEVKLPKHSLRMSSGALVLTPPITIENATWSAQEARRGDLLTLTADVKGAPDGTEAQVAIFEHDTVGAHDLVTKFPVLVQGGKVEAEWAFEYVEDPDDIPSEEESERGYSHPEYFFRVTVHGISAESGLLTFKDYIEIILVDGKGLPMPGEEYLLTFADGQQRKGKLDAKGQAIEKDIPPGGVDVSFPKIEEKDWTDY